MTDHTGGAPLYESGAPVAGGSGFADPSGVPDPPVTTVEFCGFDWRNTEHRTVCYCDRIPKHRGDHVCHCGRRHTNRGSIND